MKPYTSEREIALAALNALAQMPGGQATYEELRYVIPHYVTLSQNDLQPSLTRDGETLWEQRLRNITSHKDSPSNLIYQGYLMAIPNGLALKFQGMQSPLPVAA